MSKLEKSLARWVSQGLIEQRQANAISQYESTQSDYSWILFGLLVLGATVIGIGVISLIAANWQNIPDIIKLVTDFTILSIIAIIIVHTFNQNKTIYFEISVLMFMLLSLASIGLIAQVYNTGGELYEALMLWSIITFPVTVFSRGKLVHMTIPFIWLGGFLTGLVNAMLDSPVLIQYFHFNDMAIAMTIPLLCMCLVLLGKKLSFAEGYINALRSWLFISGFIAVGMTELGDIVRTSQTDLMTPYYPGYLLAILTAIGIVSSKDYNKAQKTVLLLALVTFVSSCHIYLTLLANYSLTYAIFTIATISLIALFTASNQQRRLFNWLLFFIGLRFLILYFQALGGLATTGVGLILSGVIIIGMAYYWNKYRSYIASLVERWMQ